ncbi:transposase [Allokutzneria sp. A3M-2-11 16]|uniref:transposase n=1 Tax=Allokutzneria sp. A3M-2-11 16 TaxID=2962043 RepID=UPI0020B75A63|nr:transposase [Allokutzneria sp. A3M-2-11 16]MCP3797959.1 transposase [Allokutzneria sp. A3M-2-11 16]
MTLEPLADYLQPRFGNIYEDDLTAVADGLDVRPWTPELTQAVMQYLVREITDEQYAQFCDAFESMVSSPAIPQGSREEQAAPIVKRCLPWEIAYAFRIAALRAVPTLDELVKQVGSWEGRDQGGREDVAEWLHVHASKDQLAELVAYVSHPERDSTTPWYQPDPTAWDLTNNLTSAELLDAWHYFISPASSDLTDAEWELLIPLLLNRGNRNGTTSPRSADELAATRRAYDGIRYKFANDVPWSHIPQRYGRGGNIYQRLQGRRLEFFAQMARSLEDVPEAAGLVEWLNRLVVKDRQ